MKIIIALVMAMVLAGCAITDTCVTNPSTGAEFCMESKTLFKDLKGVKIKADENGFEAELDSSSGSLTPAQLACLVDASNCQP
jgi:outer membrane lipoprotein SlyB